MHCSISASCLTKPNFSMYKFLLLWLALVYAYLGNSQTLIIVDKETGDPVEHVLVTNENYTIFESSNSRGQIDLRSLKGSESIEARKLGYKTIVLTFQDLENASFQIEMKRSNLNLDQIVVSATRWRQVSDDIPSKIISISTQEIELQNPQTAADLLGISGKVFVQKSQQGGGSPMIRGFATNRLLYSVDGVRMNTAIFREGNIQNVINLDPFATENTEVLFGPGSVIYGSDAIGGVMSFQTLTPQLSIDDKALVSGKAVTRYSSANRERTGHIDINLGGKKWASVTSFSAWNYGHLKQGKNGPDDYIKSFHVKPGDTADEVVEQKEPLLQIPSAYSQFNAMQKVRFRPTKNLEFNYGFHYSRTSEYGRYDRHNRSSNGTARYSVWNYGPQAWMMNNLSMTYSATNKLYDKLNIRFAIQNFEESRISRLLNNPQESTQLEEVDAYSLNIDFSKRISKRHQFFYGVEWVRNDVESTGNIEDIQTGIVAFGDSRYPDAIWNSLAFYINNDFRVTEKVILQGGLRLAQFGLSADFRNNLDFFPLPFETAEISKQALTGSIGMVYRPNEVWVFSTNLGTAFRAPNVDDIGKIFDSEPGSVTVPNPDLRAEYAYNMDIGLARVFGQKAKIDVTAFYTSLQNSLVRRDFSLNGFTEITYLGELSNVQAVQNAAVTNVYGLQAGFEIGLGKGFSFSSDLNFQEGTEELDNGSTGTARHAAPIFGISRLDYRNGRLRLQLLSQYQGKRSFNDLPVSEQSKDEIYAKDSNGNNYSPAWYIINFNSQYSLSEKINLSAGLENLTDQRYRPFSSGISGAGRNLQVSLIVRF